MDAATSWQNGTLPKKKHEREEDGVAITPSFLCNPHNGQDWERGTRMEYITVRQWGQAEFVERKSRFIGTCQPVKTEEEALAFIAQIKGDYWDASHNVYAYILREGGVQRFSDDGEPQGTAGIPVIDTLKKAGVTDTVVVATRYFGGILLGGGGLIRAYSHTASIALGAAEKVRMAECMLGEIACGYDSYGRVQPLVAECGGVVDDTVFLEAVTVRFHMEPEKLERLARRLADATAGKAALRETGKEFFPLAME